MNAPVGSPTASILVVADDVTGANAAAAAFARAGLSAVTVGNHEPLAVIADFAPRFDVVVVSSDSRHCTPQESQRRVTAIVRAGWPARLVCNRVDTTLRGTVGPSTAAMLATVSELSGRRAVALCAPAHPTAGRHTVDGTQLLHGRRLEDTELAHDPRNPMRTSDIASILSDGTGLRTGHVPLRLVTGPRDALVSAIRGLVDTVDVLVVDAIAEEHLAWAAKAAVEAAGDVTWVGVDPGPGSLELARSLSLTAQQALRRPPVLAVSGSATVLTRSQLRRLVNDGGTRVVRATFDSRSLRLDVGATATMLEETLGKAAGGEVVVLATVLDDADVIVLPPSAAEALPTDLATVVRRAMHGHPVAGLFTSGGDVTAAVLAELGARGLEVEGEVAPLAVTGALVGGAWDGTPVVTKGGLVGDSSTIVACINHLLRRAEITRRHVIAAGAALPPKPSISTSAH
jgi:uncharacterized protein YgbK (DUF1537 family)